MRNIVHNPEIINQETTYTLKTIMVEPAWDIISIYGQNQLYARPLHPIIERPLVSGRRELRVALGKGIYSDYLTIV